MINWNYIKPLENEMSIEEFEADYGVTLPEDYKELVRRVNGARPKQDTFLLPNGKRSDMMNLYSFNRSARGNMWKSNSKEDLEYGCVNFSSDSFDNQIAFRLADNAVVFHDYDTDELMELAPSFQAFLDMLREEE